MNPRHTPKAVAQRISGRTVEGMLFWGMRIDLVDKMDEILSNELSFALEEVYQQGFKDGKAER